MPYATRPQYKKFSIQGANFGAKTNLPFVIFLWDLLHKVSYIEVNSTRSNTYFRPVALFQIVTNHVEFSHAVDWLYFYLHD